MNDKILFSERQRFKQWWLWILLLGTNSLFLWAVFIQVVEGKPLELGIKPMTNSQILTGTGLNLLVTFFFASLHLDTKIMKEGIYVRFFPFHLKFRYYGWGSLTKSYVRAYMPINEYGGWGLRTGFIGKGVRSSALNVSGNMGLQLEMTDKRRLLIGTNKPRELANVLSKLGQLKE